MTVDLLCNFSEYLCGTDSLSRRDTRHIYAQRSRGTEWVVRFIDRDNKYFKTTKCHTQKGKLHWPSTSTVKWRHARTIKEDTKHFLETWWDCGFLKPEKEKDWTLSRCTFIINTKLIVKHIKCAVNLYISGNPKDDSFQPWNVTQNFCVNSWSPCRINQDKDTVTVTVLVYTL
jgi:hypothetical protein